MKTVTIIGASNDRHKFGNKAVRAFLEQGYKARRPSTPTNSKCVVPNAFKAAGGISKTCGSLHY